MNGKIIIRLMSSYSSECFMKFIWDSKLTDYVINDVYHSSFLMYVSGILHFAYIHL